ncbi:MAG: DUF805 domain-containing protein [Pseudomonadota bacterium]
MSLARLFFSFEGRIGRAGFWLGFVTLTVLLEVLRFVAINVDGAVIPALSLALVVFVLYFPLAAKRYHDLDRTGWNSLIFLMPIVGWLYLIFECGLLQGGQMVNQYGEPLYGPLAKRPERDANSATDQ